MQIGRVLNLTVRAFSGGASSVLMGLSYAISDLTMRGNRLGIAIAATGALVGGFGAVIAMGLKNAIRAAMGYDAAMRRVLTLTETLPENFDRMKSKVLELTRVIPKSAEEMADSLYFVKSVVQDDSDALGILEIAAKAASLEMSKTEPVAKVLTSAYSAYGGTLQDVKLWTDQLTLAVSIGKAEYQDFATQMGQLIGYGNTLGVKFSELTAWMAFLTKRGYSSANAAVLLKNVMLKIINPTAGAVKVFSRLGIEWGEKAIKAAGGLIPYLKEIGEKTKWNTDVLAKMFPGLRQLPLLMAMAQDAAKGQNAELQKMAEKIENASGELDRRFKDAVAGSKAQLELLKNSVNEFMIRIGTPLLNALAAVMQPVRNIINSVNAWIEANPKAAESMMKVTAAVAGFLLLTGGLMVIIGLLETVGGILAPAAIAAGVLAATIPPIIQWLTKLADEISNNTNTWTFMMAAWDNIVDTAGTLWGIISQVFDILTGNETEIKDAAKWIEDLSISFSMLTFKIKTFVQDGSLAVWVRDVMAKVQEVKEGFQRVGDNIDRVTRVLKGLVGTAAGLAIVVGVVKAFEAAMGGIALMAGAMEGVGLIFEAISGGAISIAEAAGIIGGAGWASIAGTITSAFWPIVAVIAAVAAIAYVLWTNWQTVIGFIQNLINRFAPMFTQQFSELGKAFGPLMEALGELWEAIKPVVVLVGGALLAVLAVLMGSVMGIIGALTPLITGLVKMVTGAIKILAGIVEFIVGFVKVIVGFVTGNEKLVNEGIKGIVDGVTDMVEGVIKVFTGLWDGVSGAIVGFVEGVINWFLTLYDTLVGHSIVPDLVNGIIKWISSLPGKVLAFVANLVTRFILWIDNLRQDVSKGFKGLVDKAVEWVSGLGGKVMRAVNGAGTWLLDIGKSVIQGFWDGMVKIWNDTKKWVGGLATWIKEHKGPISKDRRLLTENGRAVMQSFGGGLADEWKTVMAQVNGYNAQLAGAFAGAAAGGINGDATYRISTEQVVVHRVEFGNLPEGVRLSFTAQDVANLLKNDPAAMTTVARGVDVSLSKDIS